MRHYRIDEKRARRWRKFVLPIAIVLALAVPAAASAATITVDDDGDHLASVKLHHRSGGSERRGWHDTVHVCSAPTPSRSSIVGKDIYRGR